MASDEFGTSNQTRESAPSRRALIEVSGIVKRYPGVTALGGVSMSLAAGEVVALIGENGAGKSTLMKILGGLVRPDEGTVSVDGAAVSIDSVARATALGVALIHQELNVLDNIDVAGNIFLGREPSRFGIIDRRRLRREAAQVLERVGLPISVSTPLDRLSLAQRQMVEIAKALSLNARVLVMDEPTSSLTLSETERLLEIIHDLRERGVGIIYISHRLSEVLVVADRVVALRDGKNAGEIAKGEITHEKMVRMMVGRELKRFVRTIESGGVATRHGVEPEVHPTLPSPPAEREPLGSNAHLVTAPLDAQSSSAQVRLKVSGLMTARFPKSEVSFDVLEGEVFCLAGLVGAGRSELVQAIFGTDAACGGTVVLNGKALNLGSPQAAIEAGIGFVPEDRRAVGVIVDWNIRENISLPWLSQDWLSRAGLIDRKQESKVTADEAVAIGVKATSTDVKVANLSGGNQQKVVVAKWLLKSPQVLILDEPTRGVDVGAKAEIYELIANLTKSGVSILMVSSDMEEVLGVSDRIGVMHEGRLAGVLDRKDATEESVMRLAVGKVAA